MSNDEKLKGEIHRINGLIGKMGFSIDELFDLKENEKEITKESLDELRETFEQFKVAWKDIRADL